MLKNIRCVAIKNFYIAFIAYTYPIEVIVKNINERVQIYNTMDERLHLTDKYLYEENLGIGFDLDLQGIIVT